MERRDKINYYLDMAEIASTRSTCIRRHWGAVIVKDNNIKSTAYNGAPRGMTGCIELGKCNREKSPRGTDYTNCPAVHAEANAILQAGRERILGSNLYLVGIQANDNTYTKDPNSCTSCRRLIINAGIEKVYIRLDKNNYKVIDVQKDWANDIKNIIGGY